MLFSKIITLLPIFIIIFSCFYLFYTSQTILSLLWLIFLYTYSAIYFLLLNCTFIGLVLIIVYIGAIAMLFLYMIMFLEQSNQNRKFSSFTSFDFLFIFILYKISMVFYVLIKFFFQNYILKQNVNNKYSDIEWLAYYFYNIYNWVFIVIGFFLLIGMIISIEIAKNE